MLGGKSSSWQERIPAVLRMRAAPGDDEMWTWRSQCFCGSIRAKRYRRAWWCWHCGREKDPARRPGSAAPPGSDTGPASERTRSR